MVFAEGPAEVRRVAVSAGAAGYDLIDAAHEGYDCLVTGEPEEPSLHTARELGIHLIAAGHHATERLGVQALAERLAEEFALESEYLEVANRSELRTRSGARAAVAHVVRSEYRQGVMESFGRRAR